jgi:hypothetical protein
MAPNFTPSESMSQDFFSKQTIIDNHFYKSNDKLQNNNFHPMTKSMGELWGVLVPTIVNLLVAETLFRGELWGVLVPTPSNLVS